MEFYPFFEFLALFGLFQLRSKFVVHPRLLTWTCGVMVAVGIAFFASLSGGLQGRTRVQRGRRRGHRLDRGVPGVFSSGLSGHLSPHRRRWDAEIIPLPHRFEHAVRRYDPPTTVRRGQDSIQTDPDRYHIGSMSEWKINEEVARSVSRDRIVTRKPHSSLTTRR
jgi:hypothetical protein